MPYSTTVTGLDLSDGIADVHLIAGYAYTAATSADAPEVRLHRRLRDEHLAKTFAGRRFIRWYEHNSPPVAAEIRRSSELRALTRALLVRPAARMAAWMLRLIGTRRSRSSPSRIDRR